MKRALSVFLTIAVITVLFTACGAGQEKAKYPDTHTLYFKDSLKSGKATATFFNSASGKSEDVEMKKTSEDGDSFTFSCEGNCALYNMAYITCCDEKTREFAFNPCVSGWYRTKDDFLPYTQGEEIDYSPDFEKWALTAERFGAAVSQSF